MARKYARDNRGRFASKGAGATARGGRLKTAGGNKRDGQTIQAKGGPKGTIGKPKELKPRAIQARAAAKPATRRNKLQSGPLAGAGDSVKQGLRAMGNRAINRVETAARLSELQKAGKLIRLSPSQSKRAQSVFNDAQRKVSAAPRIAVEQRQIQLAIKADKMRRAAAKPSAGTIGKPKGLKPTAVKPASNRSGQASRGLARASKIAMETRRVQATGGAFKSPAAKAKIDRTNKIAADAQAFYSTGKRAKQAPSAATIAQVGRPGKRKAVGSISEAKAGRIVARLDANRPSQRRISGSLRKTQNAIRTHQRATAFALAPSGRARSRGNSISVNDSIRRAVANAAKKRRRAS